RFGVPAVAFAAVPEQAFEVASQPFDALAHLAALAFPSRGAVAAGLLELGELALEAAVLLAQAADLGDRLADALLEVGEPGAGRGGSGGRRLHAGKRTGFAGRAAHAGPDSPRQPKRSCSKAAMAAWCALTSSCVSERSTVW